MCSILYPPPSHIYRREPWEFYREMELMPARTDVLHQLESSTWMFEAVGPTWRSADQGGRSVWPSGQPPPSCPDTLLFEPTCHISMQAHCPKSVSYSGRSSNPCEATCHALIRRNLVPWIMPHHLVAFLAQNHLHTFSNQHLWNLLIFKPMRAFIP